MPEQPLSDDQAERNIHIALPKQSRVKCRAGQWPCPSAALVPFREPFCTTPFLLSESLKPKVDGKEVEIGLEFKGDHFSSLGGMWFPLQ